MPSLSDVLSLFFSSVLFLLPLIVSLLAAIICNIVKKPNWFIMKNKNSNYKKSVKDGACFSIVLFGPFVPLVRGHISWFFIVLIVDLLTYGFGNAIFACIYNKYYLEYLFEKGYERIS